MSKLFVKSEGGKYYKYLTRLSSLVLFIFAYAIVITGGTYAFMYYNASSDLASGTGGCFQVNYSGEVISNLSTNTVQTNETGFDNDLVDGSIANANTNVTLSKSSSCKIYTKANIYIHTNNETTAPIETVPALKYKITQGNNTIGAGVIDTKGDFLLVTVPITDTALTYNIYLWIDSSISGGLYHDTTYSGYIYADSTQTSTIPRATFLSGPEFNIKIKNIAGDSATSTSDVNTNITSIVRSNNLSISPTSNNIVSTNDSDIPIYAWFNNGTIYYYSNIDTLYMNTNSSYMFTTLDKTVSIDFNTINTSNVTNMQGLFEYSNSLKIIDLSNFDTSNVTNMRYMFDMQYNHDAKVEKIIFGKNFNTSKVTTMRYMMCNSPHLKEVDLSKFDTHNVTDMVGMFSHDTALIKIDLSSFDMSMVTGTNSMLVDMPSLAKLKTPTVYPNDLAIALPKTLYDASNNSYTSLGTGSPTTTWLSTK